MQSECSKVKTSLDLKTTPGSWSVRACVSVNDLLYDLKGSSKSFKIVFNWQSIKNSGSRRSLINPKNTGWSTCAILYSTMEAHVMYRGRHWT